MYALFGRSNSLCESASLGLAVAPGDVAVADFGDLGNVEVTFAAE